MVENATAYSLIFLYCPLQNGYDQSTLDPPLSQAGAKHRSSSPNLFTGSP
jgi:hypothetical protein